jgi:hypothetical protein
VATATLAALGQREQPGQDPLDTLVAHLQAKRLPVLLGFIKEAARSTRRLRPVGAEFDLESNIVPGH